VVLQDESDRRGPLSVHRVDTFHSALANSYNLCKRLENQAFKLICGFGLATRLPLPCVGDAEFRKEAEIVYSCNR
jgi:hypothetical protein